MSLLPPKIIYLKDCCTNYGKCQKLANSRFCIQNLTSFKYSGRTSCGGSQAAFTHASMGGRRWLEAFICIYCRLLVLVEHDKEEKTAKSVSRGTDLWTGGSCSGASPVRPAGFSLQGPSSSATQYPQGWCDACWGRYQITEILQLLRYSPTTTLLKI